MIMLHPLAARVKKPVGIFGSGLFAIKPPSHLSNKENERFLCTSKAADFSNRTSCARRCRRTEARRCSLGPPGAAERGQRGSVLPIAGFDPCLGQASSLDH